VAVLVDRTPEIVLLAADADEHLVEVLFVARLGPSSLQLVGELPTKAQAPLADALVADHDAAGGQDRLDVTQAQAEAVIQLHSVLDHLGRVAEAAVRVGSMHHGRKAAIARPGLPT